MLAEFRLFHLSPSPYTLEMMERSVCLMSNSNRCTYFNASKIFDQIFSWDEEDVNSASKKRNWRWSESPEIELSTRQSMSRSVSQKRANANNSSQNASSSGVKRNERHYSSRRELNSETKKCDKNREKKSNKSRKAEKRRRSRSRSKKRSLERSPRSYRNSKKMKAEVASKSTK